METSINDQSGGIAAETPNINSNQQPDSPITMNDTNDDLVTLKEAAAKFGCAPSSLKNNIKSGKLAAQQSGEKAPYMVRLSDVERFLRDTPGIVSIFHPRASKPAATKTVDPSSAPKAAGGQQRAVKAQTAEPAEPTVTAMKTAPVEEVPAADPQEADSTQAADATMRRRRRRRGKGGSGVTPVTSGIQPMALKALAGTTPQDRLRITACLTELLGLVASA